MVAIVIISSVLAAFLFSHTSAAPDKVVCYYDSTAGTRPGNGNFTVEDIDPKLCTHLIYTFVGINTDESVKVLNAWNDLEDDGGLGGFKRFVNLKKNAPEVKTLVAMGRWTDKIVRNSTLRATFVQNVVEFVQKYKFDGFDLGWQFPGDAKNFGIIMKEFREAFDPFGLLLTAAGAAYETAITSFYEVPQLSKYLDFINVMTYDLHGFHEGKTGCNAPLYGHRGDNPERNVQACIEAWIGLGADPKKLILGMATYGSSFILSNSNQHGVGARTSAGGDPGNYTKRTGTLGYNEIVEMLKDGQLTEQWDDLRRVPYAYKGNQWVGYDNEKSIKLKCAYAKKRNLGGGMIWTIDTDDFRGISGKKYALLKTINEAFGRSV